MDNARPSADLERNDVEGALAVFRWYREQGRETPPDLAHVLLMLQDDSDELLRRLDEEESASAPALDSSSEKLQASTKRSTLHLGFSGRRLSGQNKRGAPRCFCGRHG